MNSKQTSVNDLPAIWPIGGYDLNVPVVSFMMLYWTGVSLVLFSYTVW